MKIRLLGPVRVGVDGLDVTPSNDLQRIIATLAVRPGTSADARSRLGGIKDPQILTSAWSTTQEHKKVTRAVSAAGAVKFLFEYKDGSSKFPNRWLDCDPLDCDWHRMLNLYAQANETEDGTLKFDLLHRATDLIEDVPLEGLEGNGGSLGGDLQWYRKQMATQAADVARDWLESAIRRNEGRVVSEKAAKIHRLFPESESLCMFVSYLLYRQDRREAALECCTRTAAALANAGQAPSKRFANLGSLIGSNADVTELTAALGLPSEEGSGGFKHQFSFADVGDMYSALLGETKSDFSRPIDSDWKPDLIAGINRGGAILGGFLAKYYRMHRVMPIIIKAGAPRRGSAPELHFLVEPKYEGDNPANASDADSVRRILLVDEAYRTGAHIAFAKDGLKRTFPEVADEDLRVATLVVQAWNPEHWGPSDLDDDDRDITPDDATYYGRLVTSEGFRMPWDVQSFKSRSYRTR